MEPAGPMENFRIGAFIVAINELVRADEIERALWLCDNLPAYYRDNKPSEILFLKNEILARLATPRFYANGDYDTIVNPDSDYYKTLRGQLILKDVESLNKNGLTPHIVDLGPGEGNLPLTLKKFEHTFTYDGLGLNPRAEKAIEPYIEKYLSKDYSGKPVIYVATEIIEHLHNESDVKVEMLRNCGQADIIHLSTPKNSFDTRDVDWRGKDLGHLRAYTANDFFTTVRDMFPEYNCQFFDSVILHVRLTLKMSKFYDKIST